MVWGDVQRQLIENKNSATVTSEKLGSTTKKIFLPKLSNLRVVGRAERRTVCFTSSPYL